MSSFKSNTEMKAAATLVASPPMLRLPDAGWTDYGWTSTRKNVLALVAPMVYGETADVEVHGPSTFVDSKSVPCDQVRVRLPALAGAMCNVTGWATCKPAS